MDLGGPVTVVVVRVHLCDTVTSLLKGVNVQRSTLKHSTSASELTNSWRSIKHQGAFFNISHQEMWSLFDFNQPE